VGKYNEFDQLRKFGVRTADLTGYQFSREDVNANSLANQYAQILGNVFTHEMKPLEVEILVVEVGATPADDELFHILYDGTVMDEDDFSVLGGEAEAIADRLEGQWQQGLDLPGAAAAAVRALAGDRTLTADDLEVAVLERTAARRAFRRLTDAEVSSLLPPPAASAGAPEASAAAATTGDDAPPEQPPADQPEA
jgi:proteasome alpha subunit